MTSIVWIRNDLRMHDHPALTFAAKEGEVIPVYIDDELEEMGSAQKWFLHHALISFQTRLESAGAGLIIEQGDPEEILPRLLKKYSADSIYWNRRYEPRLSERDRKLGEQLTADDIAVKTFEGTLLFPPWDVQKDNSEPYKVFTPFYKALQKKDLPKPLPKIKSLTAPKLTVEKTVDDLGLLPSIDWTSGMEKRWTPTEQAAITRFKKFVSDHLSGYKEKRDFPASDYSSSLSPYLALGLLSARSMAQHLKKQNEQDAEPFIRQLVWRDFAYTLLVHFPSSVDEPMNEKFMKFEWDDNTEHFNKWTKGQTGYPIVDAGMRELWETGYMHNRVRMIVASFLTKHLLIHWKEGADWFWDTLVDADLANNTMGWQWVAGSGADAAPYFRVFNPTLQSEKFDGEGSYIRKWVPELKKLSDKAIHAPHEQSEKTLKEAGITLGETYPKPIVDHKAARERALDRYDKIKSSS